MVGWQGRLDAGARICPEGRRPRGFVGARLPAPQERRSGQRSLLVQPGRQDRVPGTSGCGMARHRERVARVDRRCRPWAERIMRRVDKSIWERLTRVATRRSRHGVPMALDDFYSDSYPAEKKTAGKGKEESTTYLGSYSGGRLARSLQVAPAESLLAQIADRRSP